MMRIKDKIRALYPLEDRLSPKDREFVEYLDLYAPDKPDPLDDERFEFTLEQYQQLSHFYTLEEFLRVMHLAKRDDFQYFLKTTIM